jgi:hypothetical protein
MSVRFLYILFKLVNLPLRCYGPHSSFELPKRSFCVTDFDDCFGADAVSQGRSICALDSMRALKEATTASGVFRLLATRDTLTQDGINLGLVG